MKMTKTLTALIAGAGLGLSGYAFSIGTDSGSTISNTATLSYTVNSTAVPSTSTQADFDVDTKVDLALVDNSGTPTADAGANQVLTYSLTNTSNKTLYFKLTSTATSPVFTSTTSGITVSANNVVQLLEDQTVNLSITVKVPDNAADNSTANFEVSAKVSDSAGDAITIPSGDKNSNLTGTEFIVLAEQTTDDGLSLANGDVRDGGFAVSSDITVNAPKLEATKTVTVKTSTIADTNSDTFTTTYAIPGATVTYTVVINSTGSKDAIGVTFTDDLATTAPDLDPTTIANITVLDNTDSALTATTDYTIQNDGTDGNPISISLPDIPQTEKLTVIFDINIK